MRSVNWPSLLLLAATATTTQAAPDEQRLRELLVQDCGSCHGLQRKGGLGPALLPANLEGRTVAMLTETILEGRPGTAMPPWKHLLDRDEATWLAEQLKSGL